MTKYETLNISESPSNKYPQQDVSGKPKRLIELEKEGEMERDKLRQKYLNEDQGKREKEQADFILSLQKYKCPTCKLPAESMCLCGHLNCKNNHEFNEKGELTHH